MNRKLAGLTLLFFLAVTTFSHAQSGEWAWEGGPFGTNTGIPTYGTLGVPSTQNIPAMREGSGTWTDAQGNLWLFGGYGADSVYNYGYLDDLWEYNRANATWTWVGGSNLNGPNYGQPGVYGTLGVASPSNIPGGRAPAAIWQDSKGNVWMFGGGGMDSTDTFNGDGSLNDLWMFNPTSKEWTWMGGSTTVPRFGDGQSGVYGTLGVASSSNQPGGRADSTSWTDSQGNFWLFGGSGDDANGAAGELNDLWMYSPTTNEWTWEGGSNTVAGATGVVGGQGAFAAANVPAGRYGASAWTDPNGNFWLFGGSSQQGAGAVYEDIWEFNPTTKQWAWLTGPTTPSTAASGTYGTQGTPSGSNVPPGRQYGAAWTDASGNLWLFGGLGYDSTGNQNIFNDQWMYSPATNQWTWVDGSNSVASGGDYGPQGAPSASSMPGARYAPDFWKDTSGNFWMFGGLTPVVSEGNGFYSGYGFYSDLWEYFTPTATNSGPLAGISPFGLEFEVLSGDVSTPQQITLSNPGSAALSITGFTITGAGAAAYQQTNTCASSLAAGASCTVSITFSPAASQSYPATLSIADNAPSSPQTVTLTGTGNIPTSTSIYASASVLTAGSSLNIAATVASTVGNTVPTGTVAFDEDGSPVGTGTLSGSGVATYTVTSLALGSHSFTATYPGDSSHGSSASGSVSVTGAASVQVSAPQWEWVAGGQTATFITGAPPVYGTLGTPSSANYPGDVAGGTTWTDAHGNLWLFYGENAENDLWKYNIASSQWTWVSGANIFNTVGPYRGVYGTLGTPAAGNTPGGRSDNSSWIDTKGNLWIFGGNAADSNGVFAPLNDLWMFNPATSQWTWEGGSSSAASAGVAPTGVYGTKGVASPTNVPGGRYQAMSWTDKSGNFWLFGGYGSDSTGTTAYLNDLWEYSPTTSEWTWMGGASVATAIGVYGTEGVPAAGNVPGARLSGTTWVDNSGNLWLFGGTGYTNSVYGTGFLNDLWKYSVSTNQWTWVNGSNVANAAGVFGTQGLSNSGNMPDGRENAGGWVDSAGNLWLFGGADQYNPTTYFLSDFLNDLWVYLPSLNSWAWVAGSNTGNQPGVYGTQGTPSASNIPAGRYAPLTWTDANGNFWLMGGANNELNTTFSDFDDFWTTGSAPATPAGPLASLSTSSLTFTSNVNQASASQPITVSNGGSATLNLSGISITGTGAAAFAETTNCGSTLAAGSSCSISITFTPPSVSGYPAEVLVSDTAANSPQAVRLTGTGTAVTVAATSTVLTVSASTVTTGASELLTATVSETSGNATPTGTVTFFDGVTNLGSGTLNGSGVATLTTSSLALGSNSLTATYNGDASNNSSTSSPVNVTVNAASSGNPFTSPDWAWMGGLSVIGSSTGVAPGNYGMLGVPASTNVPSGRYDPETWTDKSGNFWMMGGTSISQSVGAAYLNDLWEYSPSTLEWTWQGGANSIPGPYGAGDTFGTQGTPSAQTIPSARSGSFTWTDPSGNLWLYGGFGVDDTFLSPTPSFADFLYSFWKYTPSSGQWTWIAGTDYGVSADVVNSIPTYGVMGTPSSANFPGARSGGSTWTDSAGNLWMFGGDVVEGLTYYSDGWEISAIEGNDLWEFNPTSQQWTWEAGSQISSSAAVNPNCTPGVNGTLGVAAPGNTPSGRGGSSSWTDSAGNLWLFGGQGCGSFNINAGGNNDTWGPLNDLWKFNTTTKQWTWVAGGTNADQSGVYGTLGTPSAGNTPGERESANAWTDSSGKFWLFGGSGYDSNGNYGSFNDLWMFDPSTTEWTWEGGATTDTGSAGLPGIYGTLGVGAAGNMPGARNGGGAWTDTSGNLWLFGGAGEDASGGYGDLNDLWEYGSGTVATPQAATPTFNVPGGNYSAAQSVNLSDTTPNATIYYTIDGTTPTTNSTVYSGTAIPVASTETIEAIATANGYTQSATATATYTITAQAKTTPTVTVSPSPASVTTAQAVSVTITVSGTPTPTGSVTLTSGTYTSGSVALSNGSATISIPAGALATGTDTLTATYTPDANSSTTFTTATGTNTVAVTAAVTPPVTSTFALSAVTVTGTLSSTTPATYQITVTPQNGPFSSPISLTASGVPTGYTAVFNPPSVTPGSSASTVTLTISKTAIASARSAWPVAAPALAFIAFFFIPGKRRRRTLMLMGLAVASLGVLSASGCGGGFGLPTAHYNVTITAVGGGVTQSTTVEITVQQ